MALDHDRERRWFAYLLGEVDAEERARIEAEMREAPGEATQVKALFEGLAAWSRAPEPYRPFRIEDLDLEAALTEAPPGSPFRAGKRALLRPWPWAVAALFLLAASQVSFSFTFGQATFSWGLPDQAQESKTPDLAAPAIAQRLEALELHAAETGEYVEAVATQTLLLQDWLETAATELGYNLRLEAQARYRDTQRLYRLSSQGGFSEPEWIQASYSAAGQNR